MNIYNTSEGIYLVPSSLEDHSESTYGIYEIDSNGCQESSPFLQGPISSTPIEVPDGKYRIIIDNENPSLVQSYNFIVFYNYFPYFLSTLKKLICNGKCRECNLEGNNKLLEGFYQIFLYLQCTGILENLQLLKSKACEQFRKLKKEKDYESFYGKFVFKTEEHIKDFLANAYAGLYYLATNQIFESEEYLEKVGNMFELENTKTCLYDAGYDIKEFLEEADNLNCNCDE